MKSRDFSAEGVPNDPLHVILEAKATTTSSFEKNLDMDVKHSLRRSERLKRKKDASNVESAKDWVASVSAKRKRRK